MKYFTTTKLSDNMHETPEGFLICIGVPIARTGAMEYRGSEISDELESGKIFHVMRAADDVFRPETIASFEGKPFTITHPVDFVNPENWRDLAKGTIQNVRRGKGEYSDSLLADILVTDHVAIGLVKNGLREVSCGYEADYIQDDDGQIIQRNIIGNHLALVDSGRAGSDYAIHDHKGKAFMNKRFLEGLRARFGHKTIDEMMEKAKDDSPGTPQVPATGQPSMPAGMQSAMDEMKSMISDLGAKFDGLNKPAGDEEKPKEEPPKKDAPPKEAPAKDAEGEESSSLESRLKALEAAVAKLLESKAPAADADEEGELVGDDEEEIGDDAEEVKSDDDGEEVDDAEMPKMTGDTRSRIEILAPGMNAKTKDAKKKALLKAYETKDGKEAINAFTGGSMPVLDSAERVNSLFIGASELLKRSRSKDFASTKVASGDSAPSDSSHMTPEKMNEMNSNYYKRAGA